LQAIEEGLVEADAGHFVSHEEVCEKLSQWGEK
jgi:predicted transcriptional regulator